MLLTQWPPSQCTFAAPANSKILLLLLNSRPPLFHRRSRVCEPRRDDRVVEDDDDEQDCGAQGGQDLVQVLVPVVTRAMVMVTIAITTNAVMSPTTTSMVMSTALVVP